MIRRRTIFNPDGAWEADSLDAMQERANARAQQEAPQRQAVEGFTKAFSGPRTAPAGGGTPMPTPPPEPAPSATEVAQDEVGAEELRRRNAARAKIAQMLGIDDPSDPTAMEVMRRNRAADIAEKSGMPLTGRISGRMGTRVFLNPHAERLGYTLPEGVEGKTFPTERRPDDRAISGMSWQPTEPLPQANQDQLNAVGATPGMTKYITPSAPERGPVDPKQLAMLQAYASGENYTPKEDPDAAFRRELDQDRQRANLERQGKLQASALEAAIAKGDVNLAAQIASADPSDPNFMTMAQAALSPTPGEQAVQAETKSTEAAGTAIEGFNFQNAIQDMAAAAEGATRGEVGIDVIGTMADRLVENLTARGVSPEQARATVGQHLDQLLPGTGTDIRRGLGAAVATGLDPWGVIKEDKFSNVGNATAVREDLKRRGYLR